MNWREAAQTAPQIEAKDLAHIETSVEETEKLLALYARSLANARSDSADIAMIALKKALTEHPSWGEAALLYGICLALDGKMKRAKASFEHALSVGLVSENTTYFAQMCYREAMAQTESQTPKADAEESFQVKDILSGIFSKKKSSIYEEPNQEERGRMNAPILTRAPKSAAKAKLASNRERRDVLMQANSSNPETPDEEIDVSIPRTPAEKLRIFLSVCGIILAAAALGVFIWYVAIPGVSGFLKSQEDSTKLSFLLNEMEKYSADPEVESIQKAYLTMYPQSIESTAPIPASTTQAEETQVTTADTKATPPTNPTPTAPDMTATTQNTSATQESSQDQSSTDTTITSDSSTETDP